MNPYPIHIKPFSKIIEEYNYVKRNLEKRHRIIYSFINRGHIIFPTSNYYKFVSISDLDQSIQLLNSEINRKYTLEITASCEAKIVFYFKEILKARSRNILYTSYKRLVRSPIRHGESPLMYQHLIPVFKEVIEPMDHFTFSEFKNLVEYRNWLAHGRGWDLWNSYQEELRYKKFDFDHSISIIRSLLSNLHNFPNWLED